jgi:hypothetical protein
MTSSSRTRRRGNSRRTTSQRTQRRQKLLLSPAHELPLLIGTDLHERDLPEARIDEWPDRLDMLLDIRSAGQCLGDLLVMAPRTTHGALRRTPPQRPDRANVSNAALAGGKRIA